VGAAPARRAHQRGRAVQVDPIKLTVKAPGTKHSKLKCVEPPSNAAFNFNLRRYSVDTGDNRDDLSIVEVRRCRLPYQLKFKVPGTQRLKLRYAGPLSNVAFNFNLRHYIEVPENCVAYVMGKNGSVLRAIEEEWGTLMFFGRPSSDGRSDEGKEKLMICGARRARRGAELKVGPCSGALGGSGARYRGFMCPL